MSSEERDEMDLDWKIVTTGHDAEGRAGVRSVRSVRLAEERGPARIGQVLALAGRVTSVDQGEPGDAAATGPGSVMVEAIVVEPTASWLVEPGLPASGSFEALMVVLGELHVTVGEDEATLGPGAVFIARGQPYAARTSADTETRLLSLRAVPDPDGLGIPSLAPGGTSGPARRVRRVVAGAHPDGRAGILQDGDPTNVLVVGEEAAPMAGLADVWELGGRVSAATQGGDAPAPFELEPRAGGLKILDVELQASPPGSPVQDGGWHATSTIDVDVIISGEVHMYLPDAPPVVLEAGDILLQRGTNHLWHAVGDRPLRMTTVMIAIET